MLNDKTIFGILAITALAACGGSETGGSLGGNSAFSFSGTMVATSSATPTASSGYSQAGQPSLITNVTYDLKPEVFNYFTNNVNTLVATNATFHTTSAGGVLTVNGRDYTTTVTSSSNGNIYLAGNSGANDVIIRVYDGNYASPVFIYETDENTFALYGYAVMGANTDPANVPTSGTAEAYTGVMLGYANYNNTSYPIDEISGPITLTANFQNSTISGSGTFNDGNGNAMGSFTTPSTAIVGNTFETVPNITLTTVGSTITNAQLQGDFYGPNGEQIAGTFAATGNTVIGWYDHPRRIRCGLKRFEFNLTHQRTRMSRKCKAYHGIRVSSLIRHAITFPPSS